ncbi:MAG: maleylacetate reductase [Pseudomonadota bacterium]
MSYFQPRFASNSASVRVRFAPGLRSEIGAEVETLGCGRALILSTPPQANTALDIAGLVGSRAAGVFTKATMHTPVDITDEAVTYAQELNADCLVSVGGGSTTGLGKAIAYRTDLPQIVIPTTYAGSEATPILGQTEDGVKTTLTDPKVQPEVILYDAELVTGLPVNMTVTSALNAMAHAVEALYAQNRNPVSTMAAVEGLTAFHNALKTVTENPADLKARGETLYGAWLCGTVLGQVGMALHHKLCHTLGGSFDLPHAETHAIILPHATAFNARAAADELAPILDIFAGTNAGRALYDFASDLGAPKSLAELGVSKADLDKAARLAVQKPYWNPQPVTEADIRKLLEAAHEGAAPAF